MDRKIDGQKDRSNHKASKYYWNQFSHVLLSSLRTLPVHPWSPKIKRHQVKWHHHADLSGFITNFLSKYPLFLLLHTKNMHIFLGYCAGSQTLWAVAAWRQEAEVAARSQSPFPLNSTMCLHSSRRAHGKAIAGEKPLPAGSVSDRRCTLAYSLFTRLTGNSPLLQRGDVRMKNRGFRSLEFYL